MKRAIYIWAITLFIIGFGIIPYKIPDLNPQTDELNKLVVTHQECTCCGFFQIEKGELEIPKQFKKFFPNKINEFSTTGDDPLSSLQFDLLATGDFVIKGQIVGVDSSEGKTQNGDCQIRPTVRIKEWSPATYTSNFWTFKLSFIILYFVVSLALIIASIMAALKLRKKK